MSENILSGFYRRSDLKNLTGLSETTIWRMEKAGSFPIRKKISQRLVGWDKKEITEWVKSRVSAASY